jgi:hypothetical protein
MVVMDFVDGRDAYNEFKFKYAICLGRYLTMSQACAVEAPRPATSMGTCGVPI